MQNTVPRKKAAIVSVLKISTVGVSGATGKWLVFVPSMLNLKQVDGTTVYLPKSEEYSRNNSVQNINIMKS